MNRAHISRGTAVTAIFTLLATLLVLAGTPSARATGCSFPLAPDFQLTQSVTSGSAGVAYDLTATNNGTCGATDVRVVVQLPATSTYLGFNAVQRSWNCAVDATTNVVTCVLQSQLDQKSTQSSGASGTAEVVVNATAVSGGNKSNPPNVTESAFVTDDPQLGPGPYDPDDQVWAGSVNPKTGGTLTIGTTSFEPTISHTVTVPAGTPGVLALTEKATDPSCNASPLVASCDSDLLLNAPTISNGYTTIVMKFLGSTPPPPPAYDENDGLGIRQMLACKGQTATPPCVYSIKGFNLTSPGAYYLVTIRDSGGTHMWG